VRFGILVLALALGGGLNTCGRAKPNAASPASTGGANTSTNEHEKPVSTTVPAKLEPATAKIDFATQIRPILEARCQPCHFAGGKVYQHLPFDREATITTLGTKLFTRLKDENERRLITAFLSQQSSGR
jgi:hypothetical protein